MLQCGGCWESGDSLKPVPVTTIKFCGRANQHGDIQSFGSKIKLKTWCEVDEKWHTIYIERSTAEALGVSLIKSAA